MDPSIRQVAHLRFRACGPDVLVAARPASLAADVNRLFPSYAAAVTSGWSAKVQLAVTRTNEGYEVKGAGRTGTSDLWTDALAEVEAALAELLLKSCADHFHVHAGGCVIDETAVLVLGGPGAGKSSLTAAWIAAGVPVLGDDVILLDPQGRCVPFKRPVKVAAALLPAIGVEPPHTLFWMPGSAEAWLDPGLAGGWASPAVPALVAVVRHVPGASWRLRDLGRPELLSALLNSLFPTGRRAADGFDALADVVGRCRTVEAEFGSATQAADALAALLA